MGSLYSESLRAFLKPVLAYLDDEAVTEILINGPKEVWIEKGGQLHRTGAVFTDEGLMAAARNMAQYVGKVLDKERITLDARLPDGSRIHVLLPPVARCGTVISIRKFFSSFPTMEQLIGLGSLTQSAARFIQACVESQLNVVVSGGTGSGKTTLLNVLTRYIPSQERLITIEDSAELRLSHDHLVPLECRPPDHKGRGAITMRDLVHSSLRLRPDRIIIGEVRGGECFDMLQALNTGHGGSMTTVHANNPRETLTRLENLALLSGVELPLRAIRAQVANAFDLVVSISRFVDGTRKLSLVSEVLPLDDRGDYQTRDIFLYTQTHRDQEGNIFGKLAPTGQLPTCIDRLHSLGYHDLNEDFFKNETIIHATEVPRDLRPPRLKK